MVLYPGRLAGTKRLQLRYEKSIGDLLFLSVKGKCGGLITMQDNDVPLRQPSYFGFRIISTLESLLSKLK